MDIALAPRTTSPRIHMIVERATTTAMSRAHAPPCIHRRQAGWVVCFQHTHTYARRDCADSAACTSGGSDISRAFCFSRTMNSALVLVVYVIIRSCAYCVLQCMHIKRKCHDHDRARSRWDRMCNTMYNQCVCVCVLCGVHNERIVERELVSSHQTVLNKKPHKGPRLKISVRLRNNCEHQIHVSECACVSAYDRV